MEEIDDYFNEIVRLKKVKIGDEPWENYPARNNG